MKQMMIERPGNVPLLFKGEELVRHNSDGFEMNADRWQEIRIYKTDSGKWVTQSIGHTKMAGEITRQSVFVCNTPAEVRECLQRPRPPAPPYLPRVAQDAIRSAAAVDPELELALVEVI